MTFTGTRLAAHSAGYFGLSKAQREEACELISAHGFSPWDTWAVEYAVIDAPMLTIWVYDVDLEGKRYLKADGSGPAMRTFDVLLRCPLPDWWVPDG